MTFCTLKILRNCPIFVNTEWKISFQSLVRVDLCDWDHRTATALLIYRLQRDFHSIMVFSDWRELFSSDSNEIPQRTKIFVIKKFSFWEMERGGEMKRTASTLKLTKRLALRTFETAQNEEHVESGITEQNISLRNERGEILFRMWNESSLESFQKLQFQSSM